METLFGTCYINSHVPSTSNALLLHPLLQAHGLALLLKDLYKHVPELKEPLDAAIEISNFLGSHAWFRKLVHMKQKEIFGRILEICSHVRQHDMFA